MKKYLPFNWTFIFSTSICLVLIPIGLVEATGTPVTTHIAIDTTLDHLPGGAVDKTLHTTHDPHTGGTIEVINENNGKASGDNLFFSFSDFNIGKGDTAYFNLQHGPGSFNANTGLANPWLNVISRVTGGEISYIDGILRVSGHRLVGGGSSNKADYVDGTAGATTIEGGAKNFYFINPAGIVFGKDAVVDVPGSFYASTASTVKFNDTSYGVENGVATHNKLSSANPVSFGFLGNEAGKLILEPGATIQVFNDETLALVGSEVNIKGSKVGQVDLTKPRTGYDANGLPITTAFDPNDPSTFPRFVTKGPLFVDGIQLLVLANHGKRDVGIFANDIERFHTAAMDNLDNSEVTQLERAAMSKYNARIANNLKLDGTINIQNTKLINAGGDSEEITYIRGGNINLHNASIVSSNYGDDCAGLCASNRADEPTPGSSGIDILATGKLTLDKGHIVTETSFSPVNPAADNVAINIQAASMLMDHESTISTRSLNINHIDPEYIPNGIAAIPHGLDPQAGNINIKIGADFVAKGGSSVESSTETYGNAGKITIDAGSITLNHASIKSESLSRTNGLTGYVMDDDPNWQGDIKRAGDGSGSHNYSRTESYALLSEDPNRYDLLSHDQQHPNLDAPFDAHNPAFTTSSVAPDLVPLNLPMLLIDHNKNAGAAGGISLTAHNTGGITLTDSTVSTNILSGTQATESGKIALAAGAGSITLDGSTVSSTTSGNANAGDVTLSSAGSINMSHSSQVTTDTLGVNGNKNGNAGVIAMNSKELNISSGSLVSSSTNGLGKAGEVDVTADKLTIQGLAPIPVSQLGHYFEPNFTGIRTIASASSGGQTGTINIDTTGDVNLTNGAQISISNLATVAHPQRLIPTNININANSIYLANSQIVADSSGNVDASNINIIFKEWLKLDPSAISTIANDGNGGQIDVSGGKYIWLQDSEISTSVLGLNGNGGNINITSNYLIMDSGFIQANTAAQGASGGLVNINVGTLLPSGSSLFVGGNTPFLFQPFSGINVIQAAAPGGLNGQINATAPQLNLSGTLATLIVHSFDPNAISRNLCAIGESSSLAQSGKGGLRRQAKDGLLSTSSSMSF